MANNDEYNEWKKKRSQSEQCSICGLLRPKKYLKTEPQAIKDLKKELKVNKQHQKELRNLYWEMFRIVEGQKKEVKNLNAALRRYVKKERRAKGKPTHSITELRLKNIYKDIGRIKKAPLYDLTLAKGCAKEGIVLFVKYLKPEEHQWFLENIYDKKEYLQEMLDLLEQMELPEGLQRSIKNYKDENFKQTLHDFSKKFVEGQKPLPPEFAEILSANFWELYDD